MLTIKGRVKNGIVQPSESLKNYDAEDVLITFLNEQVKMPIPATVRETDYDMLTQILKDAQMDTGISDLAHQHDHYIHGTPKRED